MKVLFITREGREIRVQTLITAFNPFSFRAATAAYTATDLA